MHTFTERTASVVSTEAAVRYPGCTMWLTRLQNVNPPKWVRESPSFRYYESEGSELRSLGSISVGQDARWTATLTVPMPPRAVAFVEVERRGELPAGYHGAEERAFLSLPIGEVVSLLELLTGVVAQARRDGVLPAE